jgi:hypothetical protein
MDMRQANVKVNAFRDFATQLALQVTEQLCTEFEREVGLITEELVMYRTELARCGELLAHQLHREKELHGMLENIAGNHGMLVASAAEVGKSEQQRQEHQKQHMNEMVDQMIGNSSGIVNHTIGGMSEAHAVTQTHLQQAKELKNQSFTAENELNRILAILQQAPIQAQGPAPTIARVPQVAPIMSGNMRVSSPRMLNSSFPTSPGPGRPTGMYGNAMAPVSPYGSRLGPQSFA